MPINFILVLLSVKSINLNPNQVHSNSETKEYSPGRQSILIRILTKVGELDQKEGALNPRGDSPHQKQKATYRSYEIKRVSEGASLDSKGHLLLILPLTGLNVNLNKELN